MYYCAKVRLKRSGKIGKNKKARRFCRFFRGKPPRGFCRSRAEAAELRRNGLQVCDLDYRSYNQKSGKMRGIESDGGGGCFSRRICIVRAGGAAQTKNDVPKHVGFWSGRIDLLRLCSTPSPHGVSPRGEGSPLSVDLNCSRRRRGSK